MKTETLKYGTCQHCNRLVESTRKRCPNCKRKPFNQFTTFTEALAEYQRKRNFNVTPEPRA